MTASLLLLVGAICFALLALYTDSLHTKSRKISKWLGAARMLNIVSGVVFTLGFLLEVTFNGIG